MDVLLINNNPVVNRLIELCFDKTEDSIAYQDSLKQDDLYRYDLLIIDDNSFDDDMKDILESTHIGYRVLLASKGFVGEDLIIFDEIIHKPFLPSRILDIIPKVPKQEKVHEDTKILDKNEVDKIKELLNQAQMSVDDVDDVDIELKKIEAFKKHLESDGVEITSEDEYIRSITKKPKKYKKALKNLINDAIDDIIEKIGKESFKQAIKEDRVEIEFKIKERE